MNEVVLKKKIQRILFTITKKKKTADTNHRRKFFSLGLKSFNYENKCVRREQIIYLKSYLKG